MEGLKVAELAERAGIAPSTVRFYERAGLLSPAQRAHNGYRMFDESALDELAFITRAKSIGMSLEDIASLVAAWPTGECRSLQARMRDFLGRRISQVREQQAELAAFERQLRAVLDRLASRDPRPERCGHGCGCRADLGLTADPPSPGPPPRGPPRAPRPAAPPHNPRRAEARRGGRANPPMTYVITEPCIDIKARPTATRARR